MIEENTVLVLGAGSNVDYGFPLGNDLSLNICSQIKKNGDILNVLEVMGYEREEVNSFGKALNDCGLSTIDAFLANQSKRNPRYVEIGKAAISMNILQKEVHAQLFDSPPGEHWYQHLFDRLNCDITEFGEHQLSIITFNYDRSLEYFLHTALSNNFSNVGDEVIAENLNRIPIIHFYGSLGKLEWQNYDLPVMPYQSLKKGITEDIARSIGETAHSNQIIGERLFEKNQRDSHKLLRNAKHIYFLGFGFHPENVRVLMPSEFRIKGLRGTAKNMLASTKKEMSQQLKMTNFSDEYKKECFPDMTVYEYLRTDPNVFL